MTTVFHRRRQGSPRCLHCVIWYAIESWSSHQSPKDDPPTLDASNVIAKLSQVTAEMVHELPDGPQRAQFEDYARRCLEGAFEYARTGQTVAVSTGLPVGTH